MKPKPYPQAIDAERALLGALLQEPDRIRDLVELGLQPGDFYHGKHGALYELLTDRWRNGDPIDLILVCNQITHQGNAGRYGSIGYVSSLPDYAPSAVNAAHYGKVIADVAARRQVLDLGHQLCKGVHDGQPLDQLVDAATSLGRTLRRTGRTGPTTLSESVERHMDLVEHVQNGGGDPVIPTGFRDLDRKLGGGLRTTDLIILGGRPSMGKTALLLNLLASISDPHRGNVPAGFCSLEMGPEKTNNRMLSMWSQIPLAKVRAYTRWNERHGGPGETIWDHMLEASESLKQLRLHIDYRSGRTIEQIYVYAKRLVADHGIKVLGIDYLQLMKATNRRESREQQVSHMSRGLKAIAKDLHIAVIALAQLNRGLEQRKDKRPVEADLRESGSIEQDADGIWFLYRDHKYNPDSPDHEAELIIRKQRQGEAGTVRLDWLGEYQIFQDVPTLAERRAAAKAEAAKQGSQDRPVT